jgi:hypothetical protein
MKSLSPQQSGWWNICVMDLFVSFWLENMDNINGHELLSGFACETNSWNMCSLLLRCLDMGGNLQSSLDNEPCSCKGYVHPCVFMAMWILPNESCLFQECVALWDACLVHPPWRSPKNNPMTLDQEMLLWPWHCNWWAGFLPQFGAVRVRFQLSLHLCLVHLAFMSR